MSEQLAVVNPALKPSWRPIAASGPAASAVKVGVIGFGYWGPNIVRNFSALEGWHVAAVCDQRPTALARAYKAYPGVQLHLQEDRTKDKQQHQC